MASNQRWTRQQLLVAFHLYCRLPFGRLHQRNPEIVQVAEEIGRSPSAVAMKLTNIASLDPEITATGRKGLSGASALDRAMWREMQSDWATFALETEAAFAALTTGKTMLGSSPELAIERIGEDRLVEAKARIGQTFFRNAVSSAYDERCCITGLSFPTLLRAGHIIPWSVDADRRVDPRNGLLLSILHERAFDAGLFTVTDRLTIQVSQSLRVEHDPFFMDSIAKFHGQPIRRPQKFAPDRDCLAYHREHIFRP